MVDVVQELLAAFCLLDDKVVIYMSKPQPQWVGWAVIIALDLNSSMNMLPAVGLMRKPMAVPWTCS